jgi:hypothetical protein
MAGSGTMPLQLRAVLGNAEFSDTGGARAHPGTPSLPYVAHFAASSTKPLRGPRFASLWRSYTPNLSMQARLLCIACTYSIYAHLRK